MADSPTDPLADDAFFAAFLDGLIPPAAPMPGAGEILAATIHEQITSNPMFVAPVRGALGALRDAANARDPGGFVAMSPDARQAVLGEVVATQPVIGMMMLFLLGAYYQHPRVLEALGQPTGAPFPKGYQIQATSASLLSKLEARKR